MSDTLAVAREAVRAELVQAFLDRDRTRVGAAAAWLHATGLPLVEVYETLLAASAQQGPEYPGSPADVARVHEVQELARDVVAQLRTPVTGPGRGRVVVAVPDGPRHVGVAVLTHVLEDAGWRVVSAAGLDFDELAYFVPEQDAVALCLGLHEPGSVPRARRVIAQLRQALPMLAVVVGGQASERYPDLAGAVAAHATANRFADTLRALDEAANPLSPRELAVLRCVASGMSNPDTGQHLGVAPATVKTHLDRVFAKLGTRDRTAAVAFAMRSGWID